MQEETPPPATTGILRPKGDKAGAYSVGSEFPVRVAILMPSKCGEWGVSFNIRSLMPLPCPPCPDSRFPAGPGWRRPPLPAPALSGVPQGTLCLLHASQDGMSIAGREGGQPAPWTPLEGPPGIGEVLGDASCCAHPACRPPPQQERLKAQEHRVEMEEKVSKRSLEAAGKAGLAAPGPGLLPRKPPGLAAGPTGTYGKAMSPPPSPRASPVAALKAKVIQKLEDVSKAPTYAYPATPSSHPSSPPPASPPPTPGITRKEEAPENVVEKKDLELEKEAPSPFQALFSGRSEAQTPRGRVLLRLEGARVLAELSPAAGPCTLHGSGPSFLPLSAGCLPCAGSASRLWNERMSMGGSAFLGPHFGSTVTFEPTLGCLGGSICKVSDP